MNECVRFVQVRPTVQDFTQLIHVGPTHTLNFVTLLCFVEIQALHAFKWGGLAQWLAPWTLSRGITGSSPVQVTVRCGIEQVTFPQLNLCILHTFVL